MFESEQLPSWALYQPKPKPADHISTDPKGDVEAAKQRIRQSGEKMLL